MSTEKKFIESVHANIGKINANFESALSEMKEAKAAVNKAIHKMEEAMKAKDEIIFGSLQPVVKKPEKASAS